MKFNFVNIEAFSYYLPDKVVTSDQIEERLGPLYKKLKLPKGRLELMTGIRQRRVWDRGTRPSEISTKAAQAAFEKSNIAPDDIEVLIHASVCRDFLEPSTASVVHHNLKLSPRCMIFDLSNACLGVVNAIVMLSNMIELGTVKCGMVVAGENGGPLLEETIKTLLTDSSLNRKSIKKYIANLTIGSGAVAYIISHRDLALDGHKILGGATMTRSEASSLCQGDGDPSSLMMETDSEALLKEGVILAKDNWEHTKGVLGWNNETPDWILGHQVGDAHEAAIFEALELDRSKTFSTYQHLGNTGSAALPITLAQLANQGKIEKSQLVALLGIGSGLTSIMLGVEW